MVKYLKLDAPKLPGILQYRQGLGVSHTVQFISGGPAELQRYTVILILYHCDQGYKYDPSWPAEQVEAFWAPREANV